MTLARHQPAKIGIDKGSADETSVALVQTHKGGFQEIVWVEHGEKARAILRAMEGR